MATTQRIGTTETLIAEHLTHVASSTALYVLVQYETVMGMEGSTALYPIEYEGESVLLNPYYMDVGEPYSFIFSGHKLVAIKQQDEAINFYYLEDSEM